MTNATLRRRFQGLSLNNHSKYWCFDRKGVYLTIFKKVRRVMRIGGELIISAPSIAILHCVIKLLFGGLPFHNPDNQINKKTLVYSHLHGCTMNEIYPFIKSF